MADFDATAFDIVHPDPHNESETKLRDPNGQFAVKHRGVRHVAVLVGWAAVFFVVAWVLHRAPVDTFATATPAPILAALLLAPLTRKTPIQIVVFVGAVTAAFSLDTTPAHAASLAAAGIVQAVVLALVVRVASLGAPVARIDSRIALAVVVAAPAAAALGAGVRLLAVPATRPFAPGFWADHLVILVLLPIALAPQPSHLTLAHWTARRVCTLVVIALVDLAIATPFTAAAIGGRSREASPSADDDPSIPPLAAITTVLAALAAIEAGAPASSAVIIASTAARLIAAPAADPDLPIAASCAAMVLLLTAPRDSVPPLQLDRAPVSPPPQLETKPDVRFPTLDPYSRVAPVDVVLVADEDEDAVAALRRGLWSLGVAVDRAESHEAVVRMAKRGIYRSVLVDEDLPGIGLELTPPFGYCQETARDLRRQNYSGRIIVTTSRFDPTSDTVSNLAAAGVDTILTKPMSDSSLDALLASIPFAADTTAAHSEPPTPPPNPDPTEQSPSALATLVRHPSLTSSVALSSVAPSSLALWPVSPSSETSSLSMESLYAAQMELDNSVTLVRSSPTRAPIMVVDDSKICRTVL
ncbi:hypothetical protein BDK51DRAFT_35121, partial [Blyttiomyces helicus]